MKRDFADLGVTFAPEAVAESEGDDGCFEVWEQNWESMRAFLACQTQWRVVAGYGGAEWLGLDYSGVDVVLRRRGLGDDVFEDLRVMEREALKAFDDAREIG